MNAEKKAKVTQNDLKADEEEVKEAEKSVINAERALSKQLEREIPDAENMVERAKQLVQRRKEYINDLPCMKAVKTSGGVVGCPADAVEAVLEIVDYRSLHDGGEGAVRDFIEWIVLSNKNI